MVAFYQPDFVFINSETLKTLPYREVAAGIAEAISMVILLIMISLNIVLKIRKG